MKLGIGRLRRFLASLLLGDSMEDLKRKLSTQVTRVNRLEVLFDELDALKSSREISQEMIDEFIWWKSKNPLSEQPLVSVCIATYNRAKILTERSIPSVLNQTYSHLELIVVGDRCTDETEELVGRIDDPRLQFIRLEERGDYPDDPYLRWMVAGGQAMNQAMAHSKGEFITHLDDDDEYVAERLEKLVEFAKTNQCDFVWHPFWYQDPDGEWEQNDSGTFTHSYVTTSSVFYRSWFKRIEWDSESYRLREPGDWNRFRRIKYINPVCMRFSEPLLRHYSERAQSG